MTRMTASNSILPQQTDAPQSQEHELLPPLTFWQQPFVQNVVPLLTSLAVHIIPIVIALLIVKPIVESRGVAQQEQVIIPDASMTSGDVGGIPNPGIDGDPNRPAASDLVPENTRSEGRNRQPSKSLQAAVLGGSGDTAADTLIGVGAGQSIGQGKGPGVGSGESDGAQAQFGLPGGGRGAGPKFMGVGTGGANVKTIAYVCDASGSMLGLPFDLLKMELKKAVQVLVPSQAFNIVFFQKGVAEPFSRDSLVVANPSNKEKAFSWLAEENVASNSDPIPAIRLVFAQHANLMYLLTDGAFDDNDAVVAEIRKLNSSKQTRINTIAFFSPSAPDSERKPCEDVLRTIASENGGQFKVVFTTDLTR